MSVTQVSLLSDYSRLQFEYSSLVYQTPVCEDDVEVLIGSRSTNMKSRLMGGAVNFLIRLGEILLIFRMNSHFSGKGCFL
jgi:hypothetical protein